MSERTLSAPSKAKWTCPQCGCTEIAEVRDGCRVSTRILGMDSTERLRFGNHVSIGEGILQGYQCLLCSQEVKNGVEAIKTRRQLVEYLLQQK